MSDILGKVRKLNWLLQESPTGVFSFNEMCSVLSDLMDANIYVANDKGKVLGVNYKIKSDSPTISDPETGNEVFPGEYNGIAEGQGNHCQSDWRGSTENF